MPGPQTTDWLRSTIGAVREVMVKRLEMRSLDLEAQREVEMAVEELDVMWEELQGQSVVLNAERERYGEFFEHAPDAYLITDVGGRIREANRAAHELLGQALKGKPLGDYVAEEDRAAFLSRLVSLAPGAPASWETRLAGKGGKTILSVRAIPLSHSGVGGLCWLIRPG